MNRGIVPIGVWVAVLVLFASSARVQATAPIPAPATAAAAPDQIKITYHRNVTIDVGCITLASTSQLTSKLATTSPSTPPSTAPAAGPAVSIWRNDSASREFMVEALVGRAFKEPDFRQSMEIELERLRHLGRPPTWQSFRRGASAEVLKALADWNAAEPHAKAAALKNLAVQLADVEDEARRIAEADYANRRGQLERAVGKPAVEKLYQLAEDQISKGTTIPPATTEPAVTRPTTRPTVRVTHIDRMWVTVGCVRVTVTKTNDDVPVVDRGYPNVGLSETPLQQRLNYIWIGRRPTLADLTDEQFEKLRTSRPPTLMLVKGEMDRVSESARACMAAGLDGKEEREMIEVMREQSQRVLERHRQVNEKHMEQARQILTPRQIQQLEDTEWNALFPATKPVQPAKSTQPATRP